MQVASVARVTIGVPCHDGFKSEMAMSLVAALAGFPHPIHFAVHKGCYLHENRNTIFRDAIEAGSSHLIFIDSDILFPPDGLVRLLAHDKDIVGGAYNVKSLPPVTTIKLAGPDGHLVNAKGDQIPRELFQCAAVPTGFLCIKLAPILGRMSLPLFEFSRRENGNLVGEDVFFCEKARALGLQVWCDPTIELGHIGEYLY